MIEEGLLAVFTEQRETLRFLEQSKLQGKQALLQLEEQQQQVLGAWGALLLAVAVVGR